LPEDFFAPPFLAPPDFEAEPFFAPPDFAGDFLAEDFFEADFADDFFEADFFPLLFLAPLFLPEPPEPDFEDDFFAAAFFPPPDLLPDFFVAMTFLLLLPMLLVRRQPNKQPTRCHHLFCALTGEVESTEVIRKTVHALHVVITPDAELLLTRQTS
jgi:hypothetical protein